MNIISEATRTLPYIKADKMNIISDEATRTLPFFEADKTKGIIITIEGRYIPESYESSCQQMLSVLDVFEDTQIPLSVNIHISFFNKPGKKSVFIILKRLAQMHEKGKEITINWFYEADDEDMLDEGKDFAEIIKLPFRFIELPETQMTMTLEPLDGDICCLGMAGVGMIAIDWGDESEIEKRMLNGFVTQYSHKYSGTPSPCTITITGAKITSLDCKKNNLTSVN